jgi:carboxypeptidase C (cathepsin A)
MAKHLIQAVAKEKQLEEKVDKKAEDKKKRLAEEKFPEKVSVTKHKIIIDGKPVSYTAKAGMMKIHDNKNKHKANIFFVSYEKDLTEKEKLTRPITFSFNGGPGCASLWLHFAALGPKRVNITDDGRMPPPPYRFDDNPYSWLDFTDLVFIDPVGTGFSVPAEGEDPKQFWGVKEDVMSVGEFIRLYVTKNQRWLSPKYVAGESYGTTRAAGLAEVLQDKLGMDLNGIILISSILDYGTAVCTTGNDLPYVLSLPTYTAAAFYHKKLSERLMQNFEGTLKEAEEWALTDYLRALAYGNTLPEDEYEKTADKLAEYTGISKTYIKQANLRINECRFMKELLRDEYLTIGRMDTRITGMDGDAAGETPESDPSFTAGALVASLNHYLRKTLKYENDRDYKTTNLEVNMNWDWLSINHLGFASVQDILRLEMHRNRYLQVFVAFGYYDLATPYFAAEFTINQMKLDPTLKDNITMEFYNGGHMVYYPKEMMIKLRNDMVKFYEKTSAPEYKSMI